MAKTAPHKRHLHGSRQCTPLRAFHWHAHSDVLIRVQPFNTSSLSDPLLDELSLGASGVVLSPSHSKSAVRAEVFSFTPFFAWEHRCPGPEMKWWYATVCRSSRSSEPFWELHRDVRFGFFLGLVLEVFALAVIRSLPSSTPQLPQSQIRPFWGYVEAMWAYVEACWFLNWACHWELALKTLSPVACQAPCPSAPQTFSRKPCFCLGRASQRERPERSFQWSARFQETLAPIGPPLAKLDFLQRRRSPTSTSIKTTTTSGPQHKLEPTY